MGTRSFFRHAFSRVLGHYAGKRIRRTDRISLLGFRLTVHPTVFHPALFFSSRILGRYVASMPLRGKRVLDMGSGSGIIGLCAARSGASVVAVDRNPAAVEATLLNARENGLQDRISVLYGDLFDPLSGDDRFDYVIWNPPFYPKPQKDDAGLAWNAGENFEVIQRFSARAGSHLAEGGCIMIILSSDVDESHICGLLKDRGFHESTLLISWRIFEKLTIYEFRS